MRYLPNGKQMKDADTYTIEKIGLPSLVLMERAALETVRTLQEKKIDLSEALVVCGSGNNGGDGFAAARILREEGFHAEVLFVGSEAALSAECRAQKQIVQQLGIPVFTDFPNREYTVIIDAIFGVGLSRDVEGRYRTAIEWMNEKKCEKAAIDIPSGICAETGQILGVVFRSDITVSMACVKIGCELFPGKLYAKETVAVPIGIDTAYFDRREDVYCTYDQGDFQMLLPQRKPDSHKGDYGKVLMITGSRGMAGAAFLSAKAAYAVGAGLVQIYTSEENRVVLQELLPEAIISCYREEESVPHDGDLERLIRWSDVVCIGCGLGTGEFSRRLLKKVIKITNNGEKENILHRPCIIDADGLNLLSENIEILRDVSDVILTPHMREMSRLIRKEIKDISQSRIDVVKEFTEQYPVVCVLKDSRTIAAQNGHHPFLNLAGNSAMAKAGSGDVLAGVISGLAAQKMNAFAAASVGVYLHACGGDEAQKQKGSYSVLARDLIDGIEQCIKNAEKSFDRSKRYE